jgi:putative hydrolase of HD superfamily
MTLPSADLHGILAFLRHAEALKHTTRVAWTSTGQQESVAEHTWRLCLMALVLAPRFPGIDVGKLLRICIVHDLGEAIGGDISAVLQADMPNKAEQERADLLTLVAPLPQATRNEIVALWDEYEQAATPEARIAKGLDKLETILQHNQGAMPDGFDFRFNLHYGARYTADDPVLRVIRAVLDEETERRAQGLAAVTGDPQRPHGA